VPLLEQLAREGYRLAVASSSPLRVVTFVLDMFSLHNHFLTVVSGDSVGNGKPHPDIYLHTADMLGVVPAECVAIEDSINGLRSAKGAGMYCIAIPDKRLTPEQFESADVILDSLRELTSETIKSLGKN